MSEYRYLTMTEQRGLRAGCEHMVRYEFHSATPGITFRICSTCGDVAYITTHLGRLYPEKEPPQSDLGEV